MEKKYCVLCEAEDLGMVEAVYFKKIDFSGDLIPVCEFHNESLKEDSFNPFDDEQSDE